jgi:hypothetical protein
MVHIWALGAPKINFFKVAKFFKPNFCPVLDSTGPELISGRQKVFNRLVSEAPSEANFYR